MRSILAILILISICIPGFVFSQIKNPMYIQLTQKSPLSTEGPFDANSLSLIENTAAFQYTVEKDYTDWLIGYVDIKGFQNIYSNRLKDSVHLKNYRRYDSIYGFDTSALCDTNNTSRIYVFLALTKNRRIVIVDTNNDSSFLNEKKYLVDMDGEKKNLQMIVSAKNCQGNKVSHLTIPIAINTSYFDTADKIVTNPKLQVYISANFYYSGSGSANGTPFQILLRVQSFDTHYTKLLTRPKIKYTIKKSKYFFEISLGKEFSINKYYFQFKRFDPKKKIVELCYLYTDSTGIYENEYFKDFATLFGSNNNNKIIFYSGSWCVPCKPVLKKLKQVNQAKNLEIVNINYEDDSTDLSQYIADNSIPWKGLFDKKDDTDQNSWRYRYNIEGYPTLMYINSNGKILKRATGLDDCIKLLESL